MLSKWRQRWSCGNAIVLKATTCSQDNANHTRSAGSADPRHEIGRFGLKLRVSFVDGDERLSLGCQNVVNGLYSFGTTLVKSAFECECHTSCNCVEHCSYAGSRDAMYIKCTRGSAKAVA